MEDIKKLLKTLCKEAGVTGSENNASKTAKKLVEKYLDEVSIDDFGNVLGVLKSKKSNAKTLLLDAHIDEIGLIVTAIESKGFLKVDRCGGMDRRILSAQPMIVHGKKDIKGVVGSKPPHLENKEDAKKVPEFKDMYVDIGMTKEEAEKYVSLGDRITMIGEFKEMLNNRITVKALDDRSGIAAIIYALSKLDREKIQYNIQILFSVQEEIGGNGAVIGAYKLKPDMAIAVDVTTAYTPDANKYECVEMSKGTAIGYSAILNKNMSDKLVSLAKKSEIPFQYESMGGRGTGTNADEFIISRGGVASGLLSIPLRYMHTPVEMLDIDDVKATGDLLVAFINSEEIF